MASLLMARCHLPPARCKLRRRLEGQWQQSEVADANDLRKISEGAGKPDSVPLREMVIHLGLPLPATSGSQPGILPHLRGRTGSPVSLLDLAPGGVCTTMELPPPPVGSYPTISPLPDSYTGRYSFCGTFRGITPPGCCPAPCPLESGLSSGVSPGDHPTPSLSL